MEYDPFWQSQPVSDAIDVLLHVADSTTIGSSESQESLDLLALLVGRNGELEDLLQRCIEGDLEGRATRHPNGFTKVRIQLPDGRGAVRFHQWGAPVGSEDVHNHRWNFVSHVLNGALRTDAFEILEGRDFDKYLCRSVDDVHKLRLTGTCSTRRISQKFYAQGDAYFQAHDAFHLALPVARETLSMIVCGEPVSSSSWVLRKGPRIEASTAFVPNDEYRQILREIQGLIHEQR